MQLNVYMQRWKTADVHNSLASMYVPYARNAAMGLQLRSIDVAAPPVTASDAGHTLLSYSTQFAFVLAAVISRRLLPLGAFDHAADSAVMSLGQGRRC